MEQAFWLFVVIGGIACVLGVLAAAGDALERWWARR